MSKKAKESGAVHYVMRVRSYSDGDGCLDTSAPQTVTAYTKEEEAKEVAQTLNEFSSSEDMEGNQLPSLYIVITAPRSLSSSES